MKEISMERVNKAREAMLDTVKSKTLTHEQKVSAMANHADSLLDVLDYPEGLDELLNCPVEEQCICDLFEGRAPLRPRYIIPDYAKYFREGSKFLQMEPPKDLYEAINALEIFYKHVPSVTNYPVYVGKLDELLDPFVQDFDEELDFKIVGSTEADSLAGKISNESPLGKALLGKKIGETAEVETQAGVSEYMVLEIQRVS